VQSEAEADKDEVDTEADIDNAAPKLEGIYMCFIHSNGNDIDLVTHHTTSFTNWPVSTSYHKQLVSNCLEY
jgi:hypothetical protein